MATYKNGLLGPFRGKIGAAVGSGWRKIDVIRSLPSKTNTPPSTKQLAQRLKFKMAVEFLQGIKEVMKIDLNTATALVISKMEGIYPDFKIPYQEVVFTQGSLMNILSAISHSDEKTVRISWSPRLGHGASDHDVVNVVLYNVATGSFYFYNSAKRKDGFFTCYAEEIGTGLTHIWTFVSNYDATDQSNSRYCGNIIF